MNITSQQDILDFLKSTGLTGDYNVFLKLKENNKLDIVAYVQSTSESNSIQSNVIPISSKSAPPPDSADISTHDIDSVFSEKLFQENKQLLWRVKL